MVVKYYVAFILNFVECSGIICSSALLYYATGSRW